MSDSSFNPEALGTPTDGSDHDAFIYPASGTPAKPFTGDEGGEEQSNDTPAALSDPRPPKGGKGGERAPAEPPLPPSAGLLDLGAGGTPATFAGDDIYQPAPEINPVIAALIKHGLYHSSQGDVDHGITCPWEDEHGPGEHGGAYYREPTDEVPLGGFHCPCTHVGPRQVGTLLKHLSVDHKAARCKPNIRLKAGDMHRIVAAGERALAARGGYYRSNGGIVRLKTDVITGATILEPLTEQTLALALSAASEWEKFIAAKEEWTRCDVPTNVVAATFKSEGFGFLPELSALVTQPYFHPRTRRLVTAAGYDSNTGIYAAFDPADCKMPLLTKENASKALLRLQGLLTEFEFASETDRATTICGMLTASIRSSLKVAPAFNITASSPGSGKSYLASVLAPFAGCTEARSTSYPSTGEEATKTVLALAMEQPAAVCFDDMSTDWMPHGALNRMLTNGVISERKLGSNTIVTARAASFITGTGNNIRPIRDMARRVASIYLLPQTETAAMRDYEGRPLDEVRRNRAAYVVDALTIIAAWQAAGCPKADVPNVAGFEDWSGFCRHSLLWLGLDDPATSLIEQIAQDPDKEQLGNLLYAWRDTLGERATLVRQVIKHIDEERSSDLYDAVMDLPCVERGHVNQSRFGRYLGRNKNRIVNGLQLVEAQHSERRAWAVLPVSSERKKPEPLPPKDHLKGIERVWLDEPIASGKTPPAANPTAEA